MASTIGQHLFSSDQGAAVRGSRGRYAFSLYLAIALFFVATERLAPAIPEAVRRTATDIASPILAVFRTPITFAQGVLERFAGVSDLYLELESLRSENNRLRQYRDAALVLGQENERLRKILNVPESATKALVTARVVGIGGGAFEESTIINAGRNYQVKEDLPVLTEGTLIGRTISVGINASRVLMITDLNSRIPVRVERTGALAIAAGTNRPSMTLQFLPEDTSVQVGDRLLTSGHGGMFPPDIPVASVAAQQDGVIILAPLAALDRLDYVEVVDYAKPLSTLLTTENGERRR